MNTVNDLVNKQAALIAQMAEALGEVQKCFPASSPAHRACQSAIDAYATMSPDPQWQRVPEELEDLDELVSINEAKASICRTTCRPGNAEEYEATVRALRNYAAILKRARGEG